MKDTEITYPHALEFILLINFLSLWSQMFLAEFDHGLPKLLGMQLKIRITNHNNKTANFLPWYTLKQLS